MQNIIPFPLRSAESTSGFAPLSASELEAFAKRHPERVALITLKIQLATHVTELLCGLMEEIRHEVGS